MIAEIYSIEHYEADFFIVKAYTERSIDIGSCFTKEWIKTKFVMKRDQVRHLFPGDKIDISATHVEPSP